MNKRKQIFQPNKDLIKEYPFYQGYYMSDERFQRNVVSVVYWYNQKSKEKVLGNTVYLNGIGFAKGKVAQILSEIAVRIINNETLNKSDYNSLRTYGIRYVKQYVDIIKNNDKMMPMLEEFGEGYKKYASCCEELLSNIDTLLKSSNITETQKKYLEKEKNKLFGISKVEIVNKNICDIISKTSEQMEFDF